MHIVAENLSQVTAAPPTKRLRLAVLECDKPIAPIIQKYGTYYDVFKSFLENSLLFNFKDVSVESWTLEGFDVVAGEYPKSEDLEEGNDNAFDGILITGSAATAHEDRAWINDLSDWVRALITDRPHIKLIGICFGHQIVARACGGKLERNPKGWEIATTQIELTDEGQKVLGLPSDHVAMIQMHRDHVTALPPSFELLGKTDVAPVQGMVLRYPSSDDIHVLTFQGHPEYNPEIVTLLVDAREASGVLDAETVKRARAQTNIRDDGIGSIGRAIWQTLIG